MPYSTGQMTRLSERMTEIWKKIDPYFSDKNVAQGLYFQAV